MNKTSKILVIHTGGTIGMVKNKENGSLVPLASDRLYQTLPVLELYNYQIDFKTFNPLIDSSDMKPAFWLKIAKMIYVEYNNYDGFVVLHGSDTMAYSASVMSFLFENLTKPIIFTGSQLPIGVARSDGRENFINSIEIAAAQKNGKPIISEVCVFFENKLFRGNRVSKINAQNFQAFISGNYPPLAEIGVNIKYNKEHFIKPSYKELKLYNKLDSNVTILKLFPGINYNIVESVTNTKNLKALIIESFGAGNAPTDKNFIKLIKQGINKGLIIYNVTQCKGGAVEMGKYATSVKLNELGVIPGFDITTEAAIAKLMFLLGNCSSENEVKEKLQISLRGELSID